MSIEIKWQGEDPETGEKRIILAEKFAKQWFFKWKAHRRDDWTKGLVPTRQIWEHILEALQRRYHRREGVEQTDLDQVQKILDEWPVPRDLEQE
jgi:hypothetical protein